MNQPRVIFIDDESCFREGLEISIGSLFGANRAFDVDFYSHPEEAVDSIKKNPFNVCLVFMDHHFHKENNQTDFGANFIKPIKQLNPHIEVIMMSGDQTPKSLGLWLKNGADKFLYKEYDEEGKNKLQVIISEALMRFKTTFSTLLDSEQDSYLKVPDELKRIGLISRSSSMKIVADLVLQAAKTDLSVLIMGETGTGKELIAKAIHNNSNRRDKEFRTIDCTQFKNSELIASELFGSEKGAFTGAESKVGLLEMAHGGTLFLDEIHHLDSDAQGKLLRFLEDKKVRRVGGRTEKQVDVRLIFAGKPLLMDLVSEDKFLADLIYRMKEVKVELPKLSDRINDIEILCSFFINKYTNANTSIPKKIHPDAIKILKSHSWPGNIRELEKLMKITTVLVESPIILPEHIQRYGEFELVNDLIASSETLEQMNMRHKNEVRTIILKTYQACDFNLAETARSLDIKRTSLRSQCIALGIWESMELSTKRELAEDKKDLKRIIQKSINMANQVIESLV